LADEPEGLDVLDADEEPDVEALDEDEESAELDDSPLAAGTLAEEPDRESVR